MNLLCEIKTDPNELCFIMESNGSQKGSYTNSSAYNYTKYYYPLFLYLKYSDIRLLEIGIDVNKKTQKPGASLHGWKHFFTNGTIVGIDKFSKNIFEDPFIQTYLCDYTKTDAFKELWNKQQLKDDFDIIIFNTENNSITEKIKFFEENHFKIKPGGVFIIENIKIQFIEFYQQQLEKWRDTFHAFSFRLFKIPYNKNTYDNCICIIHRLW